MTHTIEAGRELDALVAEKVMGWRWIACPKSGFMLVPPTQHERMLSQHVYSDKEGSLAHKKLGHYSTNIADAWEVVQKMGMVLVENSGEAFSQPDEWNVQFVGHDAAGEPHWVSASAPTFELAACLAALKAVSA